MGSLNEERAVASLAVPVRPVSAVGSGGPDAQAIRETVGSVAHGLNNLLGAVAGLSAQLLDLTAPSRDALPVDELVLIRQAALDGLLLSRRLLHLSRGESTQGASPDLASLELVDLGRTLADAVELTRA